MHKLIFIASVIISVILMLSVSVAAPSAGAGALPPPPVMSDKDPDVKTDRLCAEAADPDAATDKIHINCDLEYGEFAPREIETAPQKAALVAAYNIERGMELDKQILLLRGHPDFRGLDVLLVSEADRGCSRTSHRNVARELARALEMNYVFAVEYIELPRKSDRAVNDNKTICEHGNAVLSRRPIIGAEQIRHKEASNNYIPPGAGRDNREPRLGGCMAIAADLDFGGPAPLRVYSAHFEGYDKRQFQESEALDIVAHAATVTGPVVVGGDMNVVPYINDLRSGSRDERATSAFIDAGFTDAHAGLSVGKRFTSGMDYGVRVIIDLIFIRGARAASSGVCPLSTCRKLSDHLPVRTRIEWD